MNKKINKNPIIVLAAGGNPTAIFNVSDKLGRKKYPKIASTFLKENPEIEQVGFLENFQHLEMSGGEFCGNASRAAALLIGEKLKRTSGSFTVSGFNGRVDYLISSRKNVTCIFPNFPFRVFEKQWDGKNITLVDMKGIVHVVLPRGEKFPRKKTDYMAIHKEIINLLKLDKQKSVGIIWQEKKGKFVQIFPIVWVKALNTYFAETACGSGTLAILLSYKRNKMKVIQPSGQEIEAEKLDKNTLILRSEMKKIY